MDYSKKAEFVKGLIDELKKIKDIVYGIEDTICGIEKQVSDLDASLPSDTELLAMPEGPEKKQILDLLDLNDQAYAIIDELIGPPQSEVTGKTLYS